MLRLICDTRTVKSEPSKKIMGSKVSCTVKKSNCPKKHNKGSMTLFCFKTTTKKRNKN